MDVSVSNFVTCERSSVALKRVSETSHLGHFLGNDVNPCLCDSVLESGLDPYVWILIYLINKVLHIFAS